MKKENQLQQIEELLKLIVKYLKLVLDHKSSLDKTYLLKAKELKEYLTILKTAYKNLAKATKSGEEVDPHQAEIEALKGVLSDFEQKEKKLQKGLENSSPPKLLAGKDLLNQVA